MLALPPAPAPARPRLLIIGTALVTGGVVLVLLALVTSYLDVRHDAGGTSALFLPKGVRPSLVIGNLMLFGMASVSVLVQWAVSALAGGARRDAGVALGTAGAVALMVLNAQAFEYGQMKLGVSTGDYATVFYSVTGAFLAALIGGLVVLFVTAFRSLGGRYTAKDTEGLIATAVYWHALSASFFVIWLVVYVFK